MLRANRLCQAFSVTTRTRRRCSGSAPTWRSWTNSSRSATCARALAHSRRACAASIGWLTLPQSMVSRTPGSSTMKRSFGLRPVCGPVVVRQGAFGHQRALAANERRLHQRGRRQVPADPARRGDAQIFEAVMIDAWSRAAARRKPPPCSCGPKAPPIKAQQRSGVDVPANRDAKRYAGLASERVAQVIAGLPERPQLARAPAASPDRS